MTRNDKLAKNPLGQQFFSAEDKKYSKEKFVEVYGGGEMKNYW